MRDVETFIPREELEKKSEAIGLEGRTEAQERALLALRDALRPQRGER